jgi:DNA/RNA-binding domain of Phe-tRNA-synthetase-like protein
MEITFDPSLSAMLKVSILQFSGISNTEYSAELWDEFEKLCSSYRDRYQTTSNALEFLAPSRTLYRKIGLDPTRRRPSSEALVRRIIQNKALYKVNTLVDCGNFCSSSFGLSIGIYDADQIHGDVELRLGKTGESYLGINKGEITIANRFAIADETGPFGNPSSDSDRTKITLETTNVLFIIYAPTNYKFEELEKHTNFAQSVFLKYCLGNVRHKSFLPA